MDPNQIETTVPVITRVDDQVQNIAMPPRPPGTQKSAWFILLVIISIVSLSAASYFYWQYSQLKSQQVSPPTPSASPVSSADPTANWQTYTNLRYKYSFKYPLDWKVSFEDTYQYSNVTISSALDKSINVSHFSGKPGDDKPNMTMNYVIDDDNYLMASFSHCASGPGIDCSGASTHEDITVFDQFLSTFKLSENSSMNMDDFLKEIVRKHLVDNKQDVSNLKFSNIRNLGQHRDVYVANFTTLPPESDYGGEWLIVGKVGTQWLAPGSGHKTTCDWVKTAGFTDENDVAYYGQSCPQ